MVMKTVRLKQMEQYIAKHGFVSINELCEVFDIHKNTVRAYVNELAEQGIVEKTYGGVSYKTYKLPTSFDERTIVSVDSKKIIGRLAAGLLEEDDVIYADSGTTVSMLFEDPAILPDHLTIITNNLFVVNWCLKNTEYTVFSLPGKADRELNCFASLETIESLRTYNFRKAFLGIRGISAKGGLSSASPIDARLKGTVLSISQQSILLAGAEKLGNPAMLNFANMDAVDVWVCDRTTAEVHDLADGSGVRLIVPK